MESADQRDGSVRLEILAPSSFRFRNGPGWVEVVHQMRRAGLAGATVLPVETGWLASPGGAGDSAAPVRILAVDRRRAVLRFVEQHADLLAQGLLLMEPATQLNIHPELGTRAEARGEGDAEAAQD